MRIALISSDYPVDPGTSAAVAYTWYHARALARLGHSVTVFCGGPGAEEGRAGSVTVRRFRSDGPYRRLRRWPAGSGPISLDRLLAQVAELAGEIREAVDGGGFHCVEIQAAAGWEPWLCRFLRTPAVVRCHASPPEPPAAGGSAAPGPGLAGLVESLGAEAAVVVTAPSRWLAERLASRLKRPVRVLPPGVDPEALASLGEAALLPAAGEVKVLCTPLAVSAKIKKLLPAALGLLLERHPEASVLLAGPAAGASRELEEGLRQQAPAGRWRLLGALAPAELRSCIRSADLVLHLEGEVPASYLLLEAMAAGRALVTVCRGGAAEAARPGVEAHLEARPDPAALAQSLGLLVQNRQWREAMGGKARERIETHHSALTLARRAVEIYAVALRLPPGTTAGGTGAPEAALGPENWFQAWWVAGTDRAAPAMAGQADGAPRFARLTLDELRFVESVLRRSWWRVAGLGEGQETAFLEGLFRLYREAATRCHEEGKADLGESGELRLPPLAHPLFAGEAVEAFVEESWRILKGAGFQGWLDEQMGQIRFVDLARETPSLRWLVAAAARHRPSPLAYETLRRIYRDPEHREGVVAADREAFVRLAGGGEFARAVAELALHAPLERPPVFAAAPDGEDRPPPAAAAPEVTVLIPAFRHERYVAGAVRSALAQTWPGIRVLVVDDCSPDGTAAAARAVADPRVEVRVNEVNLGLGATVCAALDRISTPWVALLNSDDLFHPERISRCMAVLAARPEAAVLATAVASMDGEGRLLEADATCAVDVGPRVHDWLRWHAGLPAEVAEAGRPESLEALLRCNHLLTSSNLICRTEFLRAHAAEIRELKYCVDWLLFLAAALDGVLAVLPVPLVAYRLHEENTIWFEDRNRPLFVLEQNQVVARILRLLAVRLRRDSPPEEVFFGLLRLLEDHVSRNGDTDGFALALEGLARTTSVAALGGRPDSAPALQGFAAKALVRKEVERAVRSLGGKAWELPRLAAELSRLRLSGHLGEAFRQEAEALAGEVGWRRVEQKELRDRLGDAEDELWHARERGDRLDGQVAALEAEIRRIESAFSSARVSWEAAAARQRQEAEAAAAARERDHAGEREAWTVERGRLGEELAGERLERAREAERAAAAMAALAAELGRERAGRERAEAVYGRAVRRRLQTRARLSGRERELLEAWLADRENLAREVRFLRQKGPQRAWLEAGRKALVRLFSEGRIQSLRVAAAAAARWRHARGAAWRRWRAPGGVLALARPAPFSAAESGFPAWEALSLAQAGFAVESFSWGKGGRADRAEGWSTPLHFLEDRYQVLEEDRRWCLRRHADRVWQLERYLAEEPFSSRSCTLARWAGAMGAGLVGGAGFNPSAFTAFAASRLLGLPFVWSVCGADFTQIRLSKYQLSLLGSEAELVVVDSAAAGAALQTRLAAGIRRLLVKVPAVYPAPAAKRSWRGPVCLAAAVGWILPERDFRLLAEAAHQALGAQAPLAVEILGEPLPRSESFTAMAWLRARIYELDLEHRVRVRHGLNVRSLQELLGRADLLVALYRDKAPPEGQGALLLGVLAAMASGIPVVGTRCQVLEDVLRDGESGLLVPPGDRRALAGALARLAGDAELRRRLGRAARREFEDRFLPRVSGRALAAELAALARRGRIAPGAAAR